MKNDSPFLDVQSFAATEIAGEAADAPAAAAAPPGGSPFLSLYGFEVGENAVDPGADGYVAFLNELYDEEFDEALANLTGEATAIYETHFSPEREDPQVIGYQAERLLTQHFAPLVAEGEAMFGAISRELGTRDLSTLSREQIDNLVDRYQPSAELSPSFEQFFGKLKSWASKAVDLAKKGISAAAKLGLGPILDKLKGLVKPLLQRVIQTAIGKLPPNLQPMARKLADKLPFLKEYEETERPSTRPSKMRPAASPFPRSSMSSTSRPPTSSLPAPRWSRTWSSRGCTPSASRPTPTPWPTSTVRASGSSRACNNCTRAKTRRP